MLKKSSRYIKDNLKDLLANVGDMALKRRAINIISALSIKRGDKILDLGCGNGYYLYLIDNLEPNAKLVGVDNDQIALNSIAPKLYKKNIELINSDVTNLPFKASSFNKVLVSEVIEHVENEKKLLSEIHRILKPGGLLVLTTCNINYPFFWDPVNWILQRFFNTHIKSGFWAGIWNQHFKLYQPRQLRDSLIRAGFKVKDLKLLTNWCIPFNHYLVNFMARLFYSGNLPKNISQGINKFGMEKQIPLVRLVFWLVNKFDYLNDISSGKEGVSIFVKAVKI